jgi:hypothetical protein
MTSKKVFNEAKVVESPELCSNGRGDCIHLPEWNRLRMERFTKYNIPSLNGTIMAVTKQVMKFVNN